MASPDHDHCEVRVTCGSRDEAAAIADALVAQRLAACVHLVPIASVYEWEDEVEHDDELLLAAITRDARFDAIVELVETMHSYDLPAITRVPMSGSTGYLAWVDEQTAGDPA